MIRRVMLILAVTATAVTLAACGGNSVETPSDSATAAPESGTVATQPAGDAGGGEPTDGEAADDDNNEGSFDPFPFGTPVPEESDEDRVLLEPTLAALGAPVQPTLAATDVPFGGVEVQPGDLGRPGEVSYADPAEATEPVVFDAEGGPGEPTLDPALLLFDKVTVIRAGGPGNTELTVEIFQDGAVLLDGERVTTITPQNVIDLDTLLDEIRIFEMRGVFASTFPDRNDYQYVVSVDRADGSISHRADDSLIPPELARVVQTVTQAAVGAPPPLSN